MTTTEVNGHKETKDSGTTTYKETKTPKRSRSLPSLQSHAGTSDLREAAFMGRVDTAPTEWQLLKNHELFSTADDGSFPMVKVSRSKAVSLVDGKSFPVGGGRCYRIVLSNK